MPPVPAHNRAWRGSPVMLELQREGTSRLRVFTHDNEYIGLLRERVARHMACSAKNVRMITMGESSAVSLLGGCRASMLGGVKPQAPGPLSVPRAVQKPTHCHAAPEQRTHRIYLHWLLTRRACCSRCAGQELHTDWLTVHGSGLRNRATLNAIESPEPNRFTKAPSEYRPTYERSNFTWMFSQAVRVRQRRQCPSVGAACCTFAHRI